MEKNNIFFDSETLLYLKDINKRLYKLENKSKYNISNLKTNNLFILIDLYDRKETIKVAEDLSMIAIQNHLKCELFDTNNYFAGVVLNIDFDMVNMLNQFDLAKNIFPISFDIIPTNSTVKNFASPKEKIFIRWEQQQWKFFSNPIPKKVEDDLKAFLCLFPYGFNSVNKLLKIDNFKEFKTINIVALGFDTYDFYFEDENYYVWIKAVPLINNSWEFVAKIY